MLKFTKTKKIILAALCTFGLNTAIIELPKVEANYRSSSDTGTNFFDYIENRRRARRANQLTDEQKKLLSDIEEAQQRLPKKIDKNEPVPVAFEGDDLTYNALTGEFTAKGNVDVIQLDGHRFQSANAEGNLKTQDIHIEGKSHVLQLTKDAPRVTLDGYNTVYNYGTKTGTMERVKGKAGEYYIYGKRFEFYPDHMVAYDAYQTKCGAKSPDYRVSAKRMEIWPEQIIRMYDIKFLIGGTVVGTKKYDERKMESDSDPYFPEVGYRSGNGFFVRDHFEFPIYNDNLKAVLNAYVETKNGVRSNGEIHYKDGKFLTKVLYGYYYDGDSRWIKKEPGLDLEYRRKLKILPLTYSIEYEIGKWSTIKNASTHQKLEFGLTHNTITLFNHYKLYLSTSYKITKDDVTFPRNYEKTVRGLNYGINLAREFDDRFAAYVGYNYTKNTSQNSLYDFDTDSYSNKLTMGASYRLTDKDRFVVGLKFDTKKHDLKDVDWYWYRDLHCSTAILRWRQKRNEWEARWNFTPW